MYFFRGRRLIKIGVSTDIAQRMGQVGESVELLSWAPGDRGVEQWLHRLLDKHRVRGEWFRPTSEVLYVAKHLKRLVKRRVRASLPRSTDRLGSLLFRQALESSKTRSEVAEFRRSLTHRGGWRVSTREAA